MNQLPNYMGVSLLIVTVLVLIVVFQSAGVLWKTRPWIPLAIGVVLLLSAYAATLGITGQMKQNIASAEAMAKQANSREQEVFKVLASTNEYQLKLLELVTIPLAVSLIASALFARVDRTFQARVVEYEERKEAFYERERVTAKEEASLLADLTAGARGQSVIDRYRAVSQKRLELADESWDILEDFSDLIQARLVRRTDRPGRRPPWDKR